MKEDIWEELGKGNYNQAYFNLDKKLVLKIPLSKKAKLDAPTRSVRLWNEINHDIEPKAKVTFTNIGKGWLCPYIEGKPSSDAEIARALIKIFNHCGRIITDATAHDNFKTTSSGKVVCIDIGMAMQLNPYTLSSSTEPPALKRVNSATSLTAWAKVKSKYPNFFDKCSAAAKEKIIIEGTEPKPLSVNIVKALLFMKQSRPDIPYADFILDDEDIRNAMVKAFDESMSASSDKTAKFIALKILEDIRPINFNNMLDGCIRLIDDYANARGNIIGENFCPSWTTWLFRDEKLSQAKVEKILDLKQDLIESRTVEEASAKIQSLLDNEEATQSFYTCSQLTNTLSLCLELISIDALDSESVVAVKVF